MTTENETLIGSLRRPVAAEPYASERQREEAMARAKALAESPPIVAGDRSSPADAEGALPERLAEYQVLDVLGQGGMGVVYQARHTKLDRLVALKVLRRGLMRDERARARFDREMKAVGRLSHPNIVQALDAREVDGTALLVTEHIDGWDLSQLVEQTGPLPIADACEIVRQTAVGLEYIREHGMVHRDIKPSNVMLNREGQVKILDLGLALLQVEEPSGDVVTTAGQVMGTVDYMAPEQASRSHEVDIRADIYSLGCVLYKLLTGASPFSGPGYGTPAEKMVGHARDAPPSMRLVRLEVPEGLAALVERMMSKDRASRPATPGEVAEQLAPLAEGADLRGLGRAVARAPNASSPQPERPKGSVAGAGRAFPSLAPREEGPALEPRGPGGTRRRVVYGVLSGLALMALLFGVVFRIRAGDGTLVVSLSEPNVTVEVLDEDGMVVIHQTAKTDALVLRVEPGRHRIRVEKAGTELFATEWTAVAGEKGTIRATWEPAAPSQQPSRSPSPAVAPFDAVQARSFQEAWARHAGVARETTNSLDMRMALIPAGEFQMGGKESPEELAKLFARYGARSERFDTRDSPQHRVRITKPFYLGVCEVTVGQFRQFVAATGYQTDAEKDGKGGYGWANKAPAWMQTSQWMLLQRPQFNWRNVGIARADDHPVVNVTWNDAVQFCEWLTRKEGKNYRPPTEAEWEYACRAGSAAHWCFGNDDARIGEFAWHMLNATEIGERVGQKKPNAWGLHDVHGNVLEWCADWYNDGYYMASPLDDPKGPVAGSARVARGGAWDNMPYHTGAVQRFHPESPQSRTAQLGFRVARSP
jgi:formylglycine-generating enzyme required for sulfatase activity/tRNA A-37 threonylcarbamoyl transferase component Bud32